MGARSQRTVQYGTDAAFALSDHADFEGLLAYVKRTGAKKILTMHGFATHFAACLRESRLRRKTARNAKQLELF